MRKITVTPGCDAFFKALADPSRFAIFSQLCNCRSALSVGEVHRCCDPELDQSVVSRHLAKLRDGGLLESKRRGQSVLYSVNPGAVAAVLRNLADAIESSPCCCSPSSAPLKRKKKGKNQYER